MLRSSRDRFPPRVEEFSFNPELAKPTPGNECAYCHQALPARCFGLKLSNRVRCSGPCEWQCVASGGRLNLPELLTFCRAHAEWYAKAHGIELPAAEPAPVEGAKP